MDKVMYAFLATVIVLGLCNAVVANAAGAYNYREAVLVWFRGIFTFQLHPELMSVAPIGFQLHGLVAMLLSALWPFARLVHVFSAPLGYLTRPYIVYRSTPTSSAATEPAAAGSGWVDRDDTHRGRRAGRTRNGHNTMQKMSPTAAARQELEKARAAASGRSARTLIGGHEHVMRKTLIALRAGTELREHENPGEATVQVLQGRVVLVAGGGTAGTARPVTC